MVIVHPIFMINIEPKADCFSRSLLPKLMSGEIDVSEVKLTQLNSHLA